MKYGNAANVCLQSTSRPFVNCVFMIRFVYIFENWLTLGLSENDHLIVAALHIIDMSFQMPLPKVNFEGAEPVYAAMYGRVQLVDDTDQRDAFQRRLAYHHFHKRRLQKK